MKSFIPLLLCLMFIFGAGCAQTSHVARPASNVNESQIKEKPTDEIADGAVILYWAEGCSHCESVKAKIDNARFDEKIKIIRKEAYNSDEVYQEFFTRMKYCKVPEHQMGVPMLWDGERCYLGVEQIMNALSEKLPITN